jgi:hypothetical protein
VTNGGSNNAASAAAADTEKAEAAIQAIMVGDNALAHKIKFLVDIPKWQQFKMIEDGGNTVEEAVQGVTQDVTIKNLADSKKAIDEDMKEIQALIAKCANDATPTATSSTEELDKYVTDRRELLQKIIKYIGDKERYDKTEATTNKQNYVEPQAMIDLKDNQKKLETQKNEGEEWNRKKLEKESQSNSGQPTTNATAPPNPNWGTAIVVRREGNITIIITITIIIIIMTELSYAFKQHERIIVTVTIIITMTTITLLSLSPSPVTRLYVKVSFLLESIVLIRPTTVLSGTFSFTLLLLRLKPVGALFTGVPNTT